MEKQYKEFLKETNIVKIYEILKSTRYPLEFNPRDTDAIFYQKPAISDRKMRLILCAGVRRYYDTLKYKEAIDIAENYANGIINEEEVRHYHLMMLEDYEKNLNPNTLDSISLFCLSDDTRHNASLYHLDAMQNMIPIIHDVVGNIFEPYSIYKCPACHTSDMSERQGVRAICHGCDREFKLHKWLQWNDGTVLRMAEKIYQNSRWDEVGILADALEDASCEKQDILDHLRQHPIHVKGCWVFDLLLGYK